MKTLCIFGTRPEAIKMAPIIKALDAHPNIQNSNCVTGQHTDMLTEVMSVFEVNTDYDLRTFKQGQSISQLFSKILTGLESVLKAEKPDWVLVHGDTTSMLAAGLAAFYQKVKVAHIEAGLRTYDMQSPWPEDSHRRMIAPIATHNFCPTQSAREQLLQEKIPADDITVTGNSVIDALLMMQSKINENSKLRDKLDNSLPKINKKKNLILVTAHRRENFTSGLANICDALKQLSKRDDTEIVFPVHLNPRVQDIVGSALSKTPNIHLIKPVSYPAFIRLMMQAKLILTDSGGIQEEAPSLGVPVLVMRSTTERPEAIAVNAAKLIGTDSYNIFNATTQLLDTPAAYTAMTHKMNPYGDGQAASIIVDTLFNLRQSV